MRSDGSRRNGMGWYADEDTSEQVIANVSLYIYVALLNSIRFDSIRFHGQVLYADKRLRKVVSDGDGNRGWTITSHYRLFCWISAVTFWFSLARPSRLIHSHTSLEGHRAVSAHQAAVQCSRRTGSPDSDRYCAFMQYVPHRTVHTCQVEGAKSC